MDVSKPIFEERNLRFQAMEGCVEVIPGFDQRFL